MANTYVLISSNTLSSSAASVTFSSIPSTYTDLVLKVSARAATDTKPSAMEITLNGSTTSYSYTFLRVDSAGSPQSGRSSTTTSIRAFADSASDTTANTFSNAELYIPSYTASQNKPISLFSVLEDNATITTYSPSAHAALWSVTDAITSISIKQSTGNIASGSSFYLYGIRSS